MFYRLLYPWNDDKKFMLPKGAEAWQPDSVACGPCFIPDAVRQTVEGIRFHEMLDVSLALAAHMRQVNARVPQGEAPPVGTVYVAGNRGPLSLEASAQSYMLAIAQRVAHQAGGLTFDPADPAASDVQEFCGLAYFAEVAGTEGAVARLDATLRFLTEEITLRCHDAAPFANALRVQMACSVPEEVRTPVGDAALPLAAYRIRFRGCDIETVLQALADSLAALPMTKTTSGGSGDILVLSNLWSVARV